MHQSSSVITIQFKDVPHLIFPTEAAESWQQNRLIISIQPEMSIRLQVQAKRPGIDMVLNVLIWCLIIKALTPTRRQKLMKH
jgi:glucose-6-phosphate 1-dehydrogenase